MLQVCIKTQLGHSFKESPVIGISLIKIIIIIIISKKFLVKTIFLLKKKILLFRFILNRLNATILITLTRL